MKWDAHTHSTFCPHGSSEHLSLYIERAIKQGFERYSITEHAPLPPSFSDPVPDQDSALAHQDLEAYIMLCKLLKKEYRAYIDICVGLEVDYLYGYEQETKDFLNQVGPDLDDSILSVHFLPLGQTGWTCLDYSAEMFEADLLQMYTDVDEVYRFYYQIVEKAILADLGSHKPKRIGHLTLIEKFKKRFPSKRKDIWWNQCMTVLDLVKEKGYVLDYNTAGIYKEWCGDVYPSVLILQEAQAREIPFIYGSDAHHPQEVGRSFTQYQQDVLAGK